MGRNSTWKIQAQIGFGFKWISKMGFDGRGEISEKTYKQVQNSQSITEEKSCEF